MPILQHYYTSFANRQTGSTGFQVKAMSSGIPPDTQALILRLIAYRIPPTLDERNIETHPVALRYYYENPNSCFLLCSQSNGTDDNGRPGNFFSHTLIMNPESLKQVPPIFYWRSAFWRSRDSSTNTVLDPVPPEAMEPTLDIEDILSFLLSGKRLDYFYKLMCAVVHAQSSKRRIVIMDDAENVAMWVAAVSALLPPDYRPLLSFATYHHDPYQAQFLITGTTSDSSFRASAEEYISFFVLNTELDKVSDVDDSPYAEEAARAARSIDLYYDQMLPLFELTMSDEVHKQHFPSPEYIDEQLDKVALYWRMLSQDKPQFSARQNDLEAINARLTAFEQYTTVTQEDIDELDRLSNMLAEISMEQENPAVRAIYERIMQLRKKHRIPTDQLALQHLQRASQYIKDGQEKEAQNYLDKMIQVYGFDFFERIVNHPEYWEWLNPFFNHAVLWQITAFWRCLGPYLNFGQHLESFLLISLQTLGNAWNEKQRDEKIRQQIRSLYKALASAWEGSEQELLSFAVVHYRLFPVGTISHLYCLLVDTFDLEKRIPYRAIVQQVVPDIAQHELLYEIRRGKTENGLSEFEKWISHARRNRIADIPSLIEAGLNQLWAVFQQSPEEWYLIASRILTSKVLEPLPPQWEDRLADAALARVSLSHYSPATVEMCEKYHNREGISAERRMVMNGLIAMKDGSLDQELSEQLFKYFGQLEKQRPEQAQREAESFVRQFMTHPLKEREHTLMINAVFSWGYSLYFWQPYWDALHRITIDTARAERAVGMLGYWFAADPEKFPRMPYIPQYFFLHLPEQIEGWRRERSFQEATLPIMNVISSRKVAWSSLANELLVGRKNLLAAAGRNIAALGQGLAERMRRNVDSGYASKQDEKAQAEQRRREEYAAAIAELFSPKKVRKAHLNALQETYRAELRDTFWECYWQEFTSLLLSQDAAVVLDLLSFWFEDGYQKTAPRLYLVPSFFLGLTDAIEAARKERKFAESARKIHERSLKQSFSWYGLLEEYFMEPERKGRFPLPGRRS